MSSGGRNSPWFAGVATAGTLIGHACAYAMVQPDAMRRSGLLAATGHAWLHLANEAGVVLVVACVAALVGTQLARVGHARPVGNLFRALVTFQVVAFCSMEVAERLSAAAPLDGAFIRLLVIGVVVQTLVAGVASFVLRHLLRSIARVATTAPDVLPLQTAGWLEPHTDAPGDAAPSGAQSIRGPPVLAR